MTTRSATIALVLITATATGCAAAAGPNSARPIAFIAPIRATVDHAVDGDTFRLRLPGGDLDYVRLVGIDTPLRLDQESEPLPLSCPSGR